MENNWEDIFKFDDQLSEEERMIREIMLGNIVKNH